MGARQLHDLWVRRAPILDNNASGLDFEAADVNGDGAVGQDEYQAYFH